MMLRPKLQMVHEPITCIQISYQMKLNKKTIDKSGDSTCDSMTLIWQFCRLHGSDTYVPLAIYI